MSELTANVNWIAVVAGFVAAFVLGFLWFGPLLGRPWMQGHAIPRPERPPLGALFLQAVGTFAFSWLFGVTAASGALATAILIVIAFAALTAAQPQFTNKPVIVSAIEAGYIVAMGVVLFAAQALL
jgi:hypothetical protein